MAKRLTALLRLYRLLSVAVAPFAPLLLAQRLRRGKELRERLRERRGEPTADRPVGPLIWIHGASVGEISCVVPLIEQFASHQTEVLVTSGTVTSAALAKQRMPRGVTHQFIPLDVPGYVRRFLDHWQPDLTLLVESDLWPNIILENSARGVPLILVNGRVSDSSFRTWLRFPRSIGNLLDRFDLCLARTPEDATRLRELGAPRIVTTGNIKLDVPAPPANDKALAALRAAIGSRPVIAAASTHPGEEIDVVAAHRMLRSKFPGVLTLIAPRHPERGAAVAQIASAAGLKAVLRSQSQLPDPETEIYVADTLGELGLLYRLAPVVFMGGSLVRHGGQNPIEPAKLGAALVHGPHVSNFRDIYAALDDVGGAQEITDASTLALRIAGWLADPTSRAHAANAGRVTVETQSGALQRTLSALEPYLMQLRLHARGQHHA
ncbi:MAG: 3-deoxy-D-manno-octulosonic acid transferase [Alphaproteobacteria bacterium]|nr:3-deoxy-D-manno-octulosonic acid transferase [Alphaproteobacteria bacterium]